MIELLLWAVLIGGLPTAGYYLFGYGHRLHARGRALRETNPDPGQATQQWRAELVFALNCCVWAGFGLAVCSLLKSISQLQ